MIKVTGTLGNFNPEGDIWKLKWLRSFVFLHPLFRPFALRGRPREDRRETAALSDPTESDRRSNRDDDPSSKTIQPALDHLEYSLDCTHQKLAPVQKRHHSHAQESFGEAERRKTFIQTLYVRDPA